jgi:hypothetical protein
MYYVHSTLHRVCPELFAVSHNLLRTYYFSSYVYNFSKSLASSLLRCSVLVDSNYLVHFNEPLIKAQLKNGYLIWYRIPPGQDGILKMLYIMEESGIDLLHELL